MLGLGAMGLDGKGVSFAFLGHWIQAGIAALYCYEGFCRYCSQLAVLSGPRLGKCWIGEQSTTNALSKCSATTLATTATVIFL